MHTSTLLPNQMHLLICFVLLVQFTYGQSPAPIQQTIEAIRWSSLSSNHRKMIEEIYTINHQQYCWLTNGRENASAFQQQLIRAKYNGLDPNRYSLAALLPLANHLKKVSDSALLDISITNTFIQFATDIAIGHHTENWLRKSLSRQEIAAVQQSIQEMIIQKNIAQGLTQLEPADSLYHSAKHLLQQYLDTISGKGFKETSIRSNLVGKENSPLVKRLKQFGWNSPDIKKNVQSAQRMFDLLADGKIRTTLLKELNLSMHVRAQSLSKTLNTLRWIHAKGKETVIIVVNIPSANLLLMQGDSIVLSSKIIVGKRSTPTPALISKVNEITLYPFWYVPHSIAVNEILPAVKRNPQYLTDNHLEVLDAKNNILAPKNIGWALLHKANFPYTFRQKTGCTNALGLVKLGFKSPYHVYLHDTPGKNLFHFNKRYFSHGCIRVENIKALAFYLMPITRDSIKKILQQGCLQNQQPIKFTVEKNATIVVLYRTAWFDSALQFHFYEDIYRKGE